MYLAEVVPSTGVVMKPRPYVASSSVPTLSLNGRWDFRLHATADVPGVLTARDRTAGAGAVQAELDGAAAVDASAQSTSSVTGPDSAWETIFVPSHWVLTSPEDE
ncbi:hypothetical protein, partial [Trueperella sp.]|uniref:hypothetical protein n=1 Tax=Trueperella sp. TaxID=2699835 RepID=UPI002620B06D